MAQVTFEIADEHLNTLFSLLESSRKQLKGNVDVEIKAEVLGMVLDRYAKNNPLVFRDFLQNSLSAFQAELYEMREKRVYKS